jgi:homoserine dehydrogenase
MELKLAFVGFGKVARSFARILTDLRPQTFAQFSLRWRTTAIATANHGSIYSTTDIDLADAASCVEEGRTLSGLWRTQDAPSPLSIVDHCDADVLFETTPLNPINGEPATTHVRRALGRGVNVITANKGPLAFGYHELKALAIHWGVSFRFEGAVMDGAPVFNMAEYCLPAARINGFYGILNSTSNYILTGMEAGREFDECLSEAVRMGIAEANYEYDIDGWDSAVKAVALANVLMGADARPREVERRGIRNISLADIRSAAESGLVIRPVALGEVRADELVLRVEPQAVPAASTLGAALGTSNVLTIQTDRMGEISVTETSPGVEQTAYALLSDLIRVHEEMLRGRRGRAGRSGPGGNVRR